MSSQDISREESVLRTVKKTLTDVIKDTATPPGLKHPLKEDTIAALRECLLLISDREQELASEAGREMNMRPRFVDEPRAQKEVVVPLDRTGLTRKKTDE